MALTLPYLTIEQFEGSTVHSNDAHNSPHNKLLANDIALQNAVNVNQTSIASLQSSVASINALKEYTSAYYSPSGGYWTSKPTIANITVPASTFSSFYYVEIQVGLWTPDATSAPGVFVYPVHTVQKGVWTPSLTPVPVSSPWGFVGIYTTKSGSTGHFWGRETTITRTFKHTDVSSSHTFNFSAGRTAYPDYQTMWEIQIRIYGR